MTGRYIGILNTQWDDDGRHMKLLAEFAFVDAQKLMWDVPAGAQIDGASIPRILWTVTGSPYVGTYRNASVIHDWYCSIRTRTSQSTHRMFHEAMITSGVPKLKAKIMYLAVQYAGPKWTRMDVINNSLASGGKWDDRKHYWGPGGLPPLDTPDWFKHGGEMLKSIERERDMTRKASRPTARSKISVVEFNQLVDIIVSKEMSLDEIDVLLEGIPVSEGTVLDNGLFRFSEEDSKFIKIHEN